MEILIKFITCAVFFGWPVIALLTIDQPRKPKSTYTPIVYRND